MHVPLFSAPQGALEGVATGCLRGCGLCSGVQSGVSVGEECGAIFKVARSSVMWILIGLFRLLFVHLINNHNK